MEKELKQKYVPCVIKVMKFKVEKEFAGSSGFNPEDGYRNWTLLNGNGQGTKQNQKYGNGGTYDEGSGLNDLTSTINWGN